jgi:nucleoside-diphosphate-sugar epimerase
VTGAGGFVGCSIVQALLEHGLHVTAVDRQFDDWLMQRWQQEWSTHLELYEVDVAQLSDIKVDALIHAAAITASPEEMGHSPEENFVANIDPFLQMLELAHQHKLHRAIFLSSSAVYRRTEPGPVHETDLTSPVGLYAVAKQTMENLVETMKVHYQRDLAVVRLSNIYGPAERSRPSRPRMSLVGQMIHSAATTGRLTLYRDEPARDWTFAPDVGTALYHLLKKPVLAHHLYNVAAEQVLTPMAIAQVIREHLPELELRVLDGTNPSTPPLSRCGYLSNSRLREETGFDNWTPFSEGVKRVLHQSLYVAGT